MLVLSRKKGESIKVTIPEGTLITEDMEIDLMVVDIRGDKVRLGLEAPQVVRLLREELVESAGPA